MLKRSSTDRIAAIAARATPPAPADGPPPRAEDPDAIFVERIADAVVRKIDEREKINLLAEAVMARLGETQAAAAFPAGGGLPPESGGDPGLPKEEARDDAGQG